MEALSLNSYKSSTIPDELIIQRIINCETELFEILIRRYNQTLYRVIRGYIIDDDDVNDVMQETYLKAFEKLTQFQGTASFSTWLIRIGINEALLKIRKAKKRQQFLLNKKNDLEQIIQHPANIPMNPEKRIIQRETRSLIEGAIDQLPDKYRVIFILKEVEGLGNDEIADCLGINYGNVKMRLHRAKGLLKEKLYNLSVEDNLYEFGNSKCDRMVEYVMNRV